MHSRARKIWHFALKSLLLLVHRFNTDEILSAEALLPFYKYDMCRVVGKIVCVHDVKWHNTNPNASLNESCFPEIRPNAVWLGSCTPHGQIVDFTHSKLLSIIRWLSHIPNVIDFSIFKCFDSLAHNNNNNAHSKYRREEEKNKQIPNVSKRAYLLPATDELKPILIFWFIISFRPILFICVRNLCTKSEWALWYWAPFSTVPFLFTIKTVNRIKISLEWFALNQFCSFFHSFFSYPQAMI